MMPRKIVQVAVQPKSEKSMGGIYAVADDGTLWVRPFGSHEWAQIPNLPRQVVNND